MKMAGFILHVTDVTGQENNGQVRDLWPLEVNMEGHSKSENNISRLKFENLHFH